MMIETLISQLRQLKLTGMSQALLNQQEQLGNYGDLSFEERLQYIVDYESQHREQRKQQRLLRNAKLKLNAQATEIDYQHSRGLKRSTMTSLLHCEWVAKGQNVLITGPCGCGKTYLACALGQSACLKGYSVRYFRISRLLMDLAQAKADGTYQKVLKWLSNSQLLILDDWGLEPLTAANRSDLMEIMDDRHGTNSTVLLSQLPTEQWHNAIGDNTLADAILDRLMHNAHRLKLKGESMRKKDEILTDVDHLE